MTDHLDYGATEDRTLPAVTYALYLLAFATGFTAIIGVIVAYANQGAAGPQMRSHYTFLIRTFWIGLVWCLIAGMTLGVGIPLSFILIGIPLLILAKVMFGLGAVWYGLRCIVGVIYLAQEEPYPRPHSLII
ncbi:hypothetical protein [Phenylobacterium sp.]|jgi:uncharacterized membrane protein|uniref:DUF4870 family protein n=1 Tax=Phenylobacterium sp. TaxID=1871053 RepID=UPI002F425356